MLNGADKLAGMLRHDGMVVAPGGYDCITARMIEQAGFDAAYMTGAGTAASLGYPDYGLVTMTEMVENAGRMASVLNIPLIADADTGYGNELNVVRTVREYEKRGVAGIHLEDQGFPKRCGHLDDKEIIPLDDYVAKIRAAVSAKTNKNFTVIARTDSRAVLGLDQDEVERLGDRRRRQAAGEETLEELQPRQAFGLLAAGDPVSGRASADSRCIGLPTGQGVVADSRRRPYGSLHAMSFSAGTRIVATIVRCARRPRDPHRCPMSTRCRAVAPTSSCAS